MKSYSLSAFVFLAGIVTGQCMAQAEAWKIEVDGYDYEYAGRVTGGDTPGYSDIRFHDQSWLSQVAEISVSRPEWNFGLRFASEFSYDFESVEYDRGLAERKLLNVLFDVKPYRNLTSYLGGGVGSEFGSSGEDTAVFGINQVAESRDWYELVAGADYDLTHNWAFTAQYKYFSPTNLNLFGIGGEESLQDADRSHNFWLGLRYRF